MHALCVTRKNVLLFFYMKQLSRLNQSKLNINEVKEKNENRVLSSINVYNAVKFFKNGSERSQQSVRDH